MARGKQIVLTAPFTEMTDHAGYFIQMGMASIPIWMEWVMDKKYPEWRNVKRFEDGSAKRAPAGLRRCTDDGHPAAARDGMSRNPRKGSGVRE